MNMESSLKSNITSFTSNVMADEVIADGRTVELVFAAAVDPRSAQGAIQLRRGCETLPAQIRTARRTVRIEVEGISPGAAQLVIAELLGAKGEKLVEHHVLPFSIIPISGKLPADLRIEHAVRVFINDLDVVRLQPGQEVRGGHIDVVKAVSRKDGTAAEIAFDERGERVDYGKKLAELTARRNAKYGRIHETLFNQLEKAKDADRIPIIVWPRIELPAAPYEKATQERSLRPPEAEAKIDAEIKKCSEQMREALGRFKIEPDKGDLADKNAITLRATATAEQIRGLARNDAIGAIHFDDRSAITDLGNSISIARSDRAHLAGFDGTGIRVAVWEDGPSDTTNLSFAARFATSPPASDHARLTSAIIKNVEPNKPHGHAPDCSLYSANRAGTDALKWAINDQHCTVISQSFHRNSEPGGAGLQSDDLLKDWMVLRWPFPTILQAAGNFWQGDADGISPPESEFVNHKGFNSLAIGNHNDTADAMSGDSVFRNPTSSHGDRELPELAANGTGVSAVGESMSGTSFAAPATAGVTAVLQDVDGVLCSWPEGCRAILMAAAGRNVRGGTWWQDVGARVDARDGAGAVDARAGVTIAQQRNARNGPATRHGWDVGTISSSVIGADRLATFRYHIAVPSGLLFPKVKVALAWDSAVTSSGDNPTASTLTLDLDLLVRDSRGVQVAAAASWDNSYEVAEFAAKAGEAYEIVIRRWSGTDSSWYGIAWTTTGFSLLQVVDLPPVRIFES
jgi:hypothetical protein